MTRLWTPRMRRCSATCATRARGLWDFVPEMAAAPPNQALNGLPTCAPLLHMLLLLTCLPVMIATD